MTEDYPATILEFERRFATHGACPAYLMELRWPEGFVHPRCGGCKAWPAVHDRWVCAAGWHQATVTAGTIFQHTRQPLQLWFRAMWYVTSQKNGASAQRWRPRAKADPSVPTRSLIVGNARGADAGRLRLSDPARVVPRTGRLRSRVLHVRR